MALPLPGEVQDPVAGPVVFLRAYLGLCNVPQDQGEMIKKRQVFSSRLGMWLFRLWIIPFGLTGRILVSLARPFTVLLCWENGLGSVITFTRPSHLVTSLNRNIADVPIMWVLIIRKITLFEYLCGLISWWSADYPLSSMHAQDWLWRLSGRGKLELLLWQDIRFSSHTYMCIRECLASKNVWVTLRFGKNKNIWWRSSGEDIFVSLPMGIGKSVCTNSVS